MPRGSNNYSILVDVELQTSTIKKQLDDALKEAKLKINSDDAKSASDDLKKLKDASDQAAGSADDLSLSYQAANAILRQSIDIITSMVDQVYSLDTALTEFKKVSDLSGQSLDDYVSKLTDMGNTVGRTGKPKCQTPNVGIVNQH